MDPEKNDEDLNSKEVTLSSINSSFISNIQALVVFTDQIGDVADQYDEKIFEELKREMGELGIVKFEEDTNSNNDRKRGITVDQEKKFRDVVHALRLWQKKSPQQGRLIRRGGLVLLHSYYEILMSQLIEYYYKHYPTALPSEERVLSLSDLRNLGSITKSELYLLEKETDSLLRKNIDDQFTYIKNRLHIDTQELSEYYSKFKEIIQRRNLFVHNDGIVNNIYLKLVDPHLIDLYKAEKGKYISIGTDYLSE